MTKSINSLHSMVLVKFKIKQNMCIYVCIYTMIKTLCRCKLQNHHIVTVWWTSVNRRNKEFLVESHLVLQLSRRFKISVLDKNGVHPPSFTSHWMCSMIGFSHLHKCIGIKGELSKEWWGEFWRQFKPSISTSSSDLSASCSSFHPQLGDFTLSVRRFPSIKTVCLLLPYMSQLTELTTLFLAVLAWLRR